MMVGYGLVTGGYRWLRLVMSGFWWLSRTILRHVDDWPVALNKLTDSMPCVRCAFGFARYIFLELSTTYVTMSYMFLECVCFQHLISASFSIRG